MGWLDKGFKNIVKGAKDLVQSPAGIMLLGAAAPWLSASLGTGASGTLLGKFGQSGLGKLMSSPWIKNALTNAAMQGGIATLTGSKHPWKAMGYSALASMPFTALQSAQAANAFNTKNALTGTKDAAKWYDFALGKDKIIPGDITKSYNFDTEMINNPSFTPTTSELSSGDFVHPQLEMSVGPPKVSTYFGPEKTFENLGDQMSYFTNAEKAAKFADNKGIAGAMSALTGDLDLMATAVPQIAGMYGGRMTEEEQWLAGKEKQIRLWAFQHGIPYEEAKEIWKDGYRNPYYETKTPKDYNFQFNKGGSVPYKDDYTAGGSAVGPGTGTSDSIRPVALSDGEFVFTEEATNNFPGGAGGLYSLMNSLDPNSERPEEARV
jgi:hypothetical protein